MEIIFVVWNNSKVHQNDAVEMAFRSSAGRLVLLYLSTAQSLVEPN
jgi:hypothetical protein